jgi:hypothetical protein
MVRNFAQKKIAPVITGHHPAGEVLGEREDKPSSCEMTAYDENDWRE